MWGGIVIGTLLLVFLVGMLFTKLRGRSGAASASGVGGGAGGGGASKGGT